MTRLALLLVLVLSAARPDTAAAADTRPFVRGSWAEIRRAHADRPTVVHVWALSCGPCLVELPEWATFARAHPDVDLVLVNGDRPSDPGATGDKRADKRLVKAGLGAAERWSFAEAHTDRLRFEIDPGWQGELPYTLAIARDGTVASFSGTADFKALGAWAAKQQR